jgi:hypothetical protein
MRSLLTVLLALLALAMLSPAAAPADSRRGEAGPLVIGHRGASGYRPEHTPESYSETKHPSYFRSIGLPLEEPLARALTRSGLNRRNAPVFVQSFETGNLRALDERLRVPLVQLLGAKSNSPVGDSRTYAQLATPAGLASIAQYADGVGPSKDYIVPRNADQSSAAPTSFVDDAHAARACRALVHVPARERLPAARAALVRRSCRRRRSRGGAAAVPRPGRRRVLHGQPRHRRGGDAQLAAFPGAGLEWVGGRASFT